MLENRSEQAVSTIFPSYIMAKGTNEGIKKICDTPPERVYKSAQKIIISGT